MKIKDLLKISDENNQETFLFKFLRFFIYKLAASWRFSYEGGEIPSAAVVVFWHDHIYPMTKYMAFTNSVALISPSKDGEIVANFAKGWGHEFIRGSSHKSSTKTLLTMISMAKTRKVFLTPDGPKGPRHKMKIGAFLAAQKANVPLFLIKAICQGYRFKSWDRFLVPWPFTKIKIVLSKPYFIPESFGKADFDSLIRECEEWMNEGIV